MAAEDVFSPGRTTQLVATAEHLGTPVEHVLDPNVASFFVLASGGDSACYLGTRSKATRIFDALDDELATNYKAPWRLIPPVESIGVSDGQNNGLPNMRYSLLGRNQAARSVEMVVQGTPRVAGWIGVVACDKPPVGTAMGALEQNVPSILIPDGSVIPGDNPLTRPEARDLVPQDKVDVVTAFQAPAIDGLTEEELQLLSIAGCSTIGSCGGMFTYNTMQSFLATAGLMAVDTVAPTSVDQRRMKEFPNMVAEYLVDLVKKDIRPRDIATPESLREAMIVDMAMGGSTNVVLHAPAIARSAGFDFWEESMSQRELNELSNGVVPVITNMRPYGEYSMVDMDDAGGLQVVIAELLRQGIIKGKGITVTGETLEEQIGRLDPPLPDRNTIFPISEPYKETGGLRMLGGNLSPSESAVIKIAGVSEENGFVDNKFVGQARIFESERDLLDLLADNPDSIKDMDVVVVRYMGPRAAPGMPEMLDGTSQITSICKQRNIRVSMLTDARFSGGTVGAAVGHVDEALEGNPIALIKNGDTITIDLANNTINCSELLEQDEYLRRKSEWDDEVEQNGGVHPNVPVIKTDGSQTMLEGYRNRGLPAVNGAGLSS